MKNIYVSPDIEISVIEAEDVIMLSAVNVKDSGELPSQSWSSIG